MQVRWHKSLASSSPKIPVSTSAIFANEMLVNTTHTKPIIHSNSEKWECSSNERAKNHSTRNRRGGPSRVYIDQIRQRLQQDDLHPNTNRYSCNYLRPRIYGWRGSPGKPEKPNGQGKRADDHGRKAVFRDEYVSESCFSLECCKGKPRCIETTDYDA